MRLSGVISRAILLLAMPLAPACSASPTHQESGGMMRAGPGEPTFAERFGRDLRLPVQAAAFEKMLKDRSLTFTVKMRKDERPEVAIPLPRRNPDIDPETLIGCIEIIGTHDEKRRSMEIFRAYINKLDQVFYIENAFVYTAL